jgi:hypothetical protein
MTGVLVKLGLKQRSLKINEVVVGSVFFLIFFPVIGVLKKFKPA